MTPDRPCCGSKILFACGARTDPNAAFLLIRRPQNRNASHSGGQYPVRADAFQQFKGGVVKEGEAFVVFT
jgi:hypothetical protein